MFVDVGGKEKGFAMFMFVTGVIDVMNEKLEAYLCTLMMQVVSLAYDARVR